MVVRRAHLGEYVVEPLQRAVQVDLDPARGRRHVLAVVVGAPALHKRHPERKESGTQVLTEERERERERVHIEQVCLLFKFMTERHCVEMLRIRISCQRSCLMVHILVSS